MFLTKNDAVRFMYASKACRELAGDLVYGHINIDCGASHEHVATGSNTFEVNRLFDNLLNDNYSYAKHVRKLTFDTTTIAKSEIEQSYVPLQPGMFTGGMFTTIMRLILQRTVKLESLVWRMPVDISRPLWEALHSLNSLNTLTSVEIRMFELARPKWMFSVTAPFEFPQGLEANHNNLTAVAAPLFETLNIPQSTQTINNPSQFQPQAAQATMPGQMATFTLHDGFTQPPGQHPLGQQTQGQQNEQQDEPQSARQRPPTFSKLRDLKCLGVLDIEDFNCVPEIQACIQQSARTLSKLSLSLSRRLAYPPPLLDLSTIHNPSTVPDGATPEYLDDYEKWLQKARQDKINVLSRILNISPDDQKPAEALEEACEQEQSKQDQPSPSDSKASQSVTEAVMKVEVSADKTGVATETMILDVAAKEHAEEGLLFRDAPAASFPNHRRNGTDRDTLPEDIDVEMPEGQLNLHPHEDPCPSDSDEEDAEPDVLISGGVRSGKESKVTGAPSQAPSSSEQPTQASNPENSPQQQVTITHDPFLQTQVKLLDALESGLREELMASKRPGYAGRTRLDELRDMILDLKKQIQGLAADLGGYDAEHANKQKENAAANQNVVDFARATRGLALETLSCHQIPVTASVLGKGVDLCCLVNLTLLSVGPQAGIWKLIEKENKTAPGGLPLTSVRSDNVTKSLLTCVGKLEKLERLYLLENGPNHHFPTILPKTTVTIKDIRRLVLKKRAAKLSVLSVCNHDDESKAWDMDEDTIWLLAKGAPRLRELAVSMNVPMVNTLIQALLNYKSLEALHIVHLRSEDTCVWVIRAIKEFIVNALHDRPEMKLRYLAVEYANRTMSCIERVDRWANREQGRQKAGSQGTAENTAMDNSEDADDPMDDDEEVEEDEANIPRYSLKLKHDHMYTVPWISIFQRAIIRGEI
ncbi:hypothetical protein SEUCBS140593_010095 [Sporothrix eucalyptigena]|uniref:Uncharacterized protein n=1 Tax=Sporothrix eucalyptigena TaxID=1812306 RepID=A0ABP0D004_9PEZI